MTLDNSPVALTGCRAILALNLERRGCEKPPTNLSSMGGSTLVSRSKGMSPQLERFIMCDNDKAPNPYMLLRRVEEHNSEDIVDLMVDVGQSLREGPQTFAELECHLKLKKSLGSLGTASFWSCVDASEMLIEEVQSCLRDRRRHNHANDFEEAAVCFKHALDAREELARMRHAVWAVFHAADKLTRQAESMQYTSSLTSGLERLTDSLEFVDDTLDRAKPRCSAFLL